ncbi:MAG TPA: hypothetical protein VFD69_09720 [Vicinamibacterales bacterium]|nr:hypothetical protein [Vicinamibacterales bacterium]
MEIVALFVVAFLQLAALSFEQFRETADAIKTVIATQYVEAAQAGERKRAGDVNRQPSVSLSPEP